VPRFFLPTEQIRDNLGVIRGQELVHMRKALRLGPGDRITVFDDLGWEHEAVIRALSADEGLIEILSSFEADRESPLQLTLAVGLTKGDKMDFVVEKATELGAQVIIPFASANSVPRLGEMKAKKRSERWAKVALSAAKQCGRTKIPRILPLCEFEEFARQPRPQTLKLFFWEREQSRTLDEVYKSTSDAKSVLVAVGPEGGFSLDEARLARQEEFESVSLGRRILRAETAAVSAVTLVQHLWGDLR
jgi:16S rRNA (uracil1498-N3)-methyltransferase